MNPVIVCPKHQQLLFDISNGNDVPCSGCIEEAKQREGGVMGKGRLEFCQVHFAQKLLYGSCKKCVEENLNRDSVGELVEQNEREKNNPTLITQSPNVERSRISMIERDKLIEKYSLVSKYHQMDPENDVLLRDGRSLENDMIVLVEKRDYKTELRDLSSFETGRDFHHHLDNALQYNRWVTVTQLEKGERVSFVGVFEDGIARKFEESMSCAWYARKSSLPDVSEDPVFDKPRMDIALGIVQNLIEIGTREGFWSYSPNENRARIRGFIRRLQEKVGNLNSIQHEITKNILETLSEDVTYKDGTPPEMIQETAVTALYAVIERR